MAEFIRDTVTTQGVTIDTEATYTQTIGNLIYFFIGLLEVFLAFRLVLKLMGASLNSGFVRVIYSLTGIFILPFEGIFRKGFSSGIETTSVLEPATVVALIVYAVVAWGMVKLVQIIFGKQQRVD